MQFLLDDLGRTHPVARSDMGRGAIQSGFIQCHRSNDDFRGQDAFGHPVFHACAIQFTTDLAFGRGGILLARYHADPNNDRLSNPLKLNRLRRISGCLGLFSSHRPAPDTGESQPETDSTVSGPRRFCQEKKLLLLQNFVGARVAQAKTLQHNFHSFLVCVHGVTLLYASRIGKQMGCRKLLRLIGKSHGKSPNTMQISDLNVWLFA